jgi:hypothetical protein
MEIVETGMSGGSSFIMVKAMVMTSFLHESTSSRASQTGPGQISKLQPMETGQIYGLLARLCVSKSVHRSKKSLNNVGLQVLVRAHSGERACCAL